MMTQLLAKGRAALRHKETMEAALNRLVELRTQAESTDASDELRSKLLLGEAMLRCALARKESRGAHTRLDFPDTDEAMRKTTVVRVEDGAVRIRFREIPELRQE